MSDLRSGELAHELNSADNGAASRSASLLQEHRWELHDALDAIEYLKIDLGLYSLSTRDAAKVIPTLVREIAQGTVNGRLLLRAVTAERASEQARQEKADAEQALAKSKRDHESTFNKLARQTENFAGLNASLRRAQLRGRELERRNALWASAANSLLNSMMNAGEPGADVDASYKRLQALVHGHWPEAHEASAVNAVREESDNL